MKHKKAVFVITLPLTTVKVTNDDIDDIMEAATYGCVYWCEKMTVIGEHLGEHGSEQISRGGKLKFYPMEGDKPAELTKEKFREGLYKWLKSLENDVTRVLHGNWLVSGEIDAADADSILQYALFGELVYS